MYNEESASLILRTSDLTANSTNNVGSSDANFTNMTWSNINLRTLLGAMYDKYDTFNLVPVLFSTSHGVGSFGLVDDDRLINIFISLSQNSLNVLLNNNNNNKNQYNY
jgi:hypothetical protein